MKWKKILPIGLGILLMLWLIKAPLLSFYLSHKLGIDVSVGSMNIWPSETNITSLKIGNPGGFRTRTAFQVDSVQATYKWDKLKGNPSVIDQIEMDHCFLGIEFSNPLGTRNNWTAILSRMPERNEGSGKEVEVERVVLTNVQVEIRGLGLMGQPKVRTIDRIEFDHLSSETGFPSKQLISQLFQGAGLMDHIKELIPGGPGGIIKKIIPLGAKNEEGRENTPTPLGRI